MFIGKRNFMTDTMDVAEHYLSIAKKDEEAAKALEDKALFNQAGYFYIQAMEKQVKAYIAKKVDVTNEYFAEEIRKTMGHSLNKSLELLFKLCVGNDDSLYNHLYQQLTEQVFKNVKFNALHNKVRYPTYNSKNKNYTELMLDKKDCEELNNMLSLLKQYLNNLNRI